MTARVPWLDRTLHCTSAGLQQGELLLEDNLTWEIPAPQSVKRKQETCRLPVWPSFCPRPVNDWQLHLVPKTSDWRYVTLHFLFILFSAISALSSVICCTCSPHSHLGRALPWGEREANAGPSH